MEVDFPTDHILYCSHQFYRQTTIQLPYFIHIYTSNYGQKISFGHIGKMSGKMCTFSIEKHSTKVISKGTQIQTKYGNKSFPTLIVLEK